MLVLGFLAGLLALSSAQNYVKEEALWNVAIAPPNCPPGHQYINGRCQDIWKLLREGNPFNVVIVPDNCPPNQQLINGECRDIWRQLIESYQRNVIIVPDNCPPNQQLINGQCRDIWRQTQVPILAVTACPEGTECRFVMSNVKREKRENYEAIEQTKSRNIINVPNHCPKGYRPDTLGICRPIFG